MGQTYSYDDLYSLVSKALAVAGFSDFSSQKIAENLIISQMMGYHSHGIMRLIPYGDNLRHKEISDKNQMVIKSESETHLSIDAQGSLSYAYFPDLIDKMLQKAEKQAITTLSVSHFSHIGRLGAWTQKIASKGYIVLLMCNDNGFKAVAPFGGTKACLSTNPIAFSCPYGDEQIFALDMSTSAVSFGKIRHYYYQKQSCPDYWIQDAKGKTTHNPEVIFSEPKGALMPLGGELGYKGTALAMMVDILSAGLSGGHFPNDAEFVNGLNNVSMTVWNPEYFVGKNSLKETVGDYIEFLQKAPTIDGHPVRIGGQNSWKNYQTAKKEGIIVSDELLEMIKNKVEEWGGSL